MNVVRKIAVVFREGASLADWKHNYGDMVLADRRPLGDRWYEDENEEVTLVKHFRIEKEDDIQQIYGYLFDEVILLDIYSDFLVSWLKSRERT